MCMLQTYVTHVQNQNLIKGYFFYNKAVLLVEGDGFLITPHCGCSLFQHISLHPRLDIPLKEYQLNHNYY